jgi:hypothetical protein
MALARWGSTRGLPSGCNIYQRASQHLCWVQVYCMSTNEMTIRGGQLKLPEGSVLVLHDCAGVTLEGWTITGVAVQLLALLPCHCGHLCSASFNVRAASNVRE